MSIYDINFTTAGSDAGLLAPPSRTVDQPNDGPQGLLFDLSGDVTLRAGIMWLFRVFGGSSVAEPLFSRIATWLGLTGAFVAIAYGSYQALTSAPKAPEAQPVSSDQISILIAAAPIARGEVIAADKLHGLPTNGPLPTDALTSSAAAVGHIAIADIATNQLVLASLITTDASRAGLGSLIPEGMRAVALRISDEIAVSNLVHPGDRVDVEVVLRENLFPASTSSPNRAENPSEARTLLQNVKVLTVGETLTSTSPPAAANGNATTFQKSDPVRTLTLALTPGQVTLLTLARTLGQYALALRNPRDTDQHDVPTITLAEVRGLIASQSAPQLADTAPQIVPQNPIELISGTDHRLIYPTLIQKATP